MTKVTTMEYLDWYGYQKKKITCCPNGFMSLSQKYFDALFLVSIA